MYTHKIDERLSENVCYHIIVLPEKLCIPLKRLSGIQVSNTGVSLTDNQKKVWLFIRKKIRLLISRVVHYPYRRVGQSLTMKLVFNIEKRII